MVMLFWNCNTIVGPFFLGSRTGVIGPEGGQRILLAAFQKWSALQTHDQAMR
jgi:hypothetical protein